MESGRFAEFFASTRHGVFRAVFAATGTRTGAEDAVAEAYARAYARWATVSVHPNPTAWILRTALNAHRSWWRRARREVLAASPPDAPSLAGSGGALDERVRTAVRALPRRQREVVALRLLADLSAEETGSLLGMATATVHVHLHRALSTLRRQLGADPPDGRPPAAPDEGATGRTGAALTDVREFSMGWAVGHAF